MAKRKKKQTTALVDSVLAEMANKDVAYFAIKKHEKEFFMVSAVLEFLNWCYMNQENDKELEKIDAKIEALVKKWLKPKKTDLNSTCKTLAFMTERFDRLSTKNQRAIATNVSEAHKLLKIFNKK